MFKLFAELIAFHLDAADERLAASEAGLLDERADVRSCASSSSPCSATTCATRWPRSQAGARLLKKTPLTEEAYRIST